MRSRRSVTVLTALAALVAVGLAGNPPAIEWQRTYGGYGAADGWWVEPTGDGGYIAAGHTWWPDDPGDTLIALYLVKTDSTGQAVWERKLAGGCNARAYCVLPTSDRGYVLAGVGGVDPSPATLGMEQPFLMRTDSVGYVLWRRVFVVDSFEWGYCVVQAPDGGYALSCMNPGRDAGLCLIRTDSAGMQVWQRSYPVPYGLHTDFVPVVPTSDGGYLIGTRGFLKTDSTGSSIWYRTYSGVSDIQSVIVAQDGNYVATGKHPYGSSPDHPDSVGVLLLKTDPTGNPSWLRDIGNRASRGGHSVWQTNDSGFVVAATAYPPSSSRLSGLVIRTDSAGTPLWSRWLSSDVSSAAHSIRQAADGGFIVAGWLSDPSDTGMKLALWKLTPEGK